MEIQSIHSSAKTATAAAQDEDTSPASGFAALLDLVGTQFRATLGIGMDPVTVKTDARPEPVRAPDPRENRPRPERADDRDANAKPADDAGDSEENQTDETASTEQQSAEGQDTGAQTQAGQQHQTAAVVAAAADVPLVAQIVAAGPAVVDRTATDETIKTVAAVVDTASADIAADETALQAAETVVAPKAAVQAEIKTAEKVVVAEAVVKDPVRVQQAISAYAPSQHLADAAPITGEAEAAAVETTAAAKETATRNLEVRSATAQEQANSLARLLGSENRIQVQVNVNAAQAAKPSVADVSVYNIYAGYTAADAISLANGQYGQADGGEAIMQARTAENAGQSAASAGTIAAQATAQLAAQASAQASNASSPASAARTEGISPVSVQASAPSGGAANANLGFSAFAQSNSSPGTGQAQAAAHANPAERPAATAQHVIDQIKVNITKAAKAGLDRVTIQLKPVELGRIEIKLEMSEDHRVRVTVTADTKETLTLLQTDARTLERTLNEAGLRTDANNLHFNLRSESDAKSADGQNGRGARGGADGQEETANGADEDSYDYTAAAYARGGVDTFA